MMKNVDILKGALIAMAIMVFHSYSLEAAEIHFFVRGSLVETQTTDNNGHVLGYTPTATGSDKPFMGWSEVNQTEPIQDPASLNLFTDFTDKVFAESTNLYAIYAVCSEGELKDKMKTNGFDSQEDKDFWELSTNASVVNNTMVSGSVYTTPNAVQLKMPKSSTGPVYITTKEKIEYLNKISFWIKKKGGASNKFTAQFSSNGTEWTDMNIEEKPTGTSFEYTEVEATMPSIQSAYVRIMAIPISSGDEYSFFVDYVTFYYKQAQHIYSDYSTDGGTATSIVIAGGTGQVELSDLKLDETKTVIVQAGGVVIADKLTTISNLAIEKVNGQSSQVLLADSLTVTNHVYFDVDIQAAAMTWYDIAVPFTVDRLNGLSFPDGSDIPLNDVLVYNGATRAANGANGSAWEYQDDGDLVPGKGYYIMFETPVETIRFTKKADAPLNNENEELKVSEFTSENLHDASWNFVANNSLRYVNLGFEDAENIGVIAQTYNPNTDNYVACAQNATTYLVGTPFFVQVAKADKINWGTDETHSTLRAPMMTTNRVERFTLELSSKGEMNDRLFVSADENANNEYQIGKDVAKMGISSTIAQLWVENYNTQLCANDAVLYNDQATFPLGVFVPSNGEYTLAVTKGPDNAELYLTEDGQPIWNLSKGAYTVEMGKGTHKEYGLMLQVTDAQAPTNLNGLNDRDKAVTFLKNRSIYILRNAKLYNVQGQRVR